MLRESSVHLNTLHDGAVYFESFVMVIPDSWNPAECGLSMSELTPDMAYRTADVRIDSADPVRGAMPFVEHSAGCGAQADFIYLSTDYLVSMKNATVYSQQFVKLWSEFR